MLCCFSVQILHSAVGLVKSNPMLTGFQVFSRVFLLWGVVWSVPEVGSVCKCLYVYPSAHAHMYVCVCVCVHCVYVNVQVCVCLSKHVCVGACTCVDVYCMCLYLYTCMQSRVCFCYVLFLSVYFFYVLFPQHCRCQTTFQL